MPSNNPAQDRYNPPGTTSPDFESVKFSEINTGELFWLEENKDSSNHAYRKTSETNALNTKLQEVRTFTRNDDVFFKI